MKRIKYILVILGIIIISFLIIIGIDYTMIKGNKKPIFSKSTGGYDDGGTVEYKGFGYKIIKYNKINGSKKIAVGPWFLKYK